MPRSGSKRSQEGFAREKPPETSRKEIKDASHYRVCLLTPHRVPLGTAAFPWPGRRWWTEGGRGRRTEEVEEKEEM